MLLKMLPSSQVCRHTHTGASTHPKLQTEKILLWVWGRTLGAVWRIGEINMCWVIPCPDSGFRQRAQGKGIGKVPQACLENLAFKRGRREWGSSMSRPDCIWMFLHTSLKQLELSGVFSDS